MPIKGIFLFVYKRRFYNRTVFLFIEKKRCGMEIVDRGREKAVHRRGQATQSPTHERAPRLQVPTPSQAQDTP
jgi:hypothetical protein